MKKNVLCFIAFIFYSTTIISQSVHTANKYFKEFNYPKAAEIYKSLYQKGNESKIVLSRIADSYYYNVETEKAAPWYKLLIEKYPDVNSEYLFRYAQVLKSNGNYELSDKYMLLFRDKETNDNRSEELTTTPNYVEIYNKKSGRILSLNNVSTNTKYSDFGGFGLDNTFYFSSSSSPNQKEKNLYVWNSQPYLDIYKSTIEEKDNHILDLKNKELINLSVKTKYHESNAIITKDGKTMYFTRNTLEKNKKGNLKLCKATYINKKWDKIEELPFNSNLDDFGFWMNSDRTKGFFSSNRKGGKGADDVYSFVLTKPKEYCSQILTGLITNANTKTVLDNTTIKLLDSEDKVINNLQIDSLGVYKTTINIPLYKLKKWNNLDNDDITVNQRLRVVPY